MRWVDSLGVPSPLAVAVLSCYPSPKEKDRRRGESLFHLLPFGGTRIDSGGQGNPLPHLPYIGVELGIRISAGEWLVLRWLRPGLICELKNVTFFPTGEHFHFINTFAVSPLCSCVEGRADGESLLDQGPET